ncbi:MAG: lamin tail domain-containing protein, partial [Sedimentisphaerales bacterium]|nr:lamin tail domain-containing protein [Sedimentisphaerales bacterium]
MSLSSQSSAGLKLEHLENRLLLSVLDNLRITELMYHPGAPLDGTPEEGYQDDDFEYIELQNTSATETLVLTNVKFTQGIDYTFPVLNLGPKEYIVVVRNQTAFGIRYDTSGIRIAPGEFVGGSGLKDEGELIRLKTEAGGDVIQEFEYNGIYYEDLNGDGVINENTEFLYEDNNNNSIYDEGIDDLLFNNWYPVTNGKRYSLTFTDPMDWDLNSWDERENWQPSSQPYGTPGEADPFDRKVVINEILTHTDVPGGDWIELHNISGAPVDIGGWFLSDDPEHLKNYEIAAGTVIPTGGYIVFSQSEHFGNVNDPGSSTQFGLSEHGEFVLLSEGDGDDLTGVIEEKDFGVAEVEVSFGRFYKNSSDSYNFVAMSENTPGLVNAYPKVGPVVINEIMYNPGDLLGDADGIYEYIELFNISGESVTFYNETLGLPWKFTDGIDYSFPTDTPITLDSGEYLLMVKDKTAFMNLYNVPPDIQVIQWGDDPTTSSSLRNSGERLELGMPGDEVEIIDGEEVFYYIRVDRVNYSDGSHPVGTDPWPIGPDGPAVLGSVALVRDVAFDYGNDVENWYAGTPLNSPPQFISLSISPNPAAIEETVTISTVDTLDRDGSIVQVEFYHDVDNDGFLDKTDTFLGEGQLSSGQWSLTVPAGDFPVGTNRFFATGKDDEGKWSNIIGATATVYIPNKIPEIGSLSVSPDILSLGEPLTLTANQVADPDGTVNKVEFYRDANSNGILEVTEDELLYIDLDAADGWVWSGSTATFSLDENIFFARAADNQYSWSEAVAGSVFINPVVNIPPSIESLGIEPDSVIQGDTVTLTAVRVEDTDGDIKGVEFYLDDGDGQLNINLDTTLGTGIISGDEWSWTGPTGDFPIGVQRVFAQAEDNSSSLSNPVSALLTIEALNVPPTISGLELQPDPIVYLGDSLTITALNAADSDGQVSQVEFYRNDDGIDILLGTDTDGSDGWSWTESTAGFDYGVNHFLARVQDDDGAWSELVTISGSVNQIPEIGFMSITPTSVIVGENIILNAQDAFDPDGSILSVEFFRDGNGDGIFQRQDDILLGEDIDSQDGWSWVGSTSGFSLGDNTFFARALDNVGAYSAIATADGFIEEFSLTAGLDASRTVQYTQPDGALVSVKLANGTAQLYFSGESVSCYASGSTTIVETPTSLSLVQLTSSNEKTSLTITVKGGQAALGGLTGD